MSFLCALFGHKPHEKTYTGAEYMEVQLGENDGIGRSHATVFARCARCKKKYRAGQIHLPPKRVTPTEARS
jgi:hypothetical protein